MRISDWISDVCSSDLALSTVRGTVQADILKEDQGQNTCIFSTEFALKMMGDSQQYFVEHRVQNFYSVSISEIGRASCRERVCQYVEISVVDVSLKKKTIRRPRMQSAKDYINYI